MSSSVKTKLTLSKTLGLLGIIGAADVLLTVSINSIFIQDAMACH